MPGRDQEGAAGVDRELTLSVVPAEIPVTSSSCARLSFAIVAFLSACCAVGQVHPQAFSGGPDAEAQALEMEQEGHGMRGPREDPIPDPRDLNGLWRPGATPRKRPLLSVNDVFALEDVPMLPAAKKLTDRIEAIRNSGRPVQLASTACRSHAVSTVLFPSFVTAIVQTQTTVVLLFEQPRLIQKIRLNAKHPESLRPTYAGDSVGHWEGNTLVVETIGFNGLGELDISGAPISAKARMTQRISKAADGKSLNIQITVEDPEYLSAPFTSERRWLWTNGIQQGEFDCEENPREDMNEQTYYLEKLYEPVCLRVEGTGAEPSRVVCRKPSASN
jgi:hypothetical protein